MTLNFNEQSEKPRFTYKRNPLVSTSFQIFEWKEEKTGYEPVGEYTLIDTTEASDITEKKLINLMAIMNERHKLIDFKDLTKQRILFTLVPTTPESETQKVVFRTYDGSGVSKENAVLILEKGVFHETE